MRKLTLEETERHFKLAVEKAREFFLIPSEVEITVIHESPRDRADGSVAWIASSLRACIRYDIESLQSRGADIWSVAGHEVAHLVGREFLALMDNQDVAGKAFEPEFKVHFLEALEMQTVRLERLFLKLCPDPGALGGLYGEI